MDPPIRNLIYVTPPDAWNFEVASRFFGKFLYPSFTNFPTPKVYQSLMRRKGDMKQVPCWRRTNIDVTVQRSVIQKTWRPSLPSLQFGLRNLEFRNRKPKEILSLFYTDGITWKLTRNVIKIVKSFAEIMATNITSRYHCSFSALHYEST